MRSAKSARSGQVDVPKMVRKIRDRRQRARKVNVTYRLTGAVIEQFKSACRIQKVMPGSVIEEFMRHFSGDRA